MPMNLRLRDDRKEALKLRAEQEEAGVHAMVLKAVDDYLARTEREALVRKAAKEQTVKWAGLLERPT